MEPASASRFANALALAVIKDLGWSEVPLPEGAMPPLLRMVAHQQGALVIARGDGLPINVMEALAEAWYQRFDGKLLPPTWQALGILFVFEGGAGPVVRSAVAGCARSRSFSTRRFLVGSVDLLDSTTDFKRESRLDVSGPLARVLAEWRAGEARIDTTVYRQGVQAEVERSQDFVGRLLRNRPWGTWAIFAVCVAMYLWTERSGGSTHVPTLLRFGADFGPLFRQGEWWRLVGGMFLHIGVFHLFVNMMSLLSVGRAVEQFFGTGRYLALYVVAGVAGALASVLRSDIPSAGASGAIFGLCGAAVVLGFRYRREIPPAYRKGIAGGMITCIGLNLVLGFSIPFIDNSAHIGGLVAGALFAALVPPAVTEGESKGSTSRLTLAMLVLGLAMFAVEGYVAWRAYAFPALPAGH